MAKAKSALRYNHEKKGTYIGTCTIAYMSVIRGLNDDVYISPSIAQSNPSNGTGHSMHSFSRPIQDRTHLNVLANKSTHASLHSTRKYKG